MHCYNILVFAPCRASMVYKLSRLHTLPCGQRGSLYARHAPSRAQCPTSHNLPWSLYFYHYLSTSITDFNLVISQPSRLIQHCNELSAHNSDAMHSSPPILSLTHSSTPRHGTMKLQLPDWLWLFCRPLLLLVQCLQGLSILPLLARE